MAALRLLSRSPPRALGFRPSLPSINARQASTLKTAGSKARTVLYATAFTISAGLFAVYYFDARSAIHRYVLTPLMRHALDAETSHKLAVKVLRSGMAPRDPLQDDERLRTRLWDRELTNPIGLAAGFDKDAEAIDGLFGLGFSWVEVGSVTPKPQAGNPRPRMFHLNEDSAVINRYGFPSRGRSYVLSRLRARTPAFAEEASAAYQPGSLLAVNLGKNKDSPADSIDDFVNGVKTFGPYCDALVINVSSPNTPGLRGLQNRKSLEELLAGVNKLAPDLNESQLLDIADVIKESSIDAVIVSNTTTCRPSNLVNANKSEIGGLSGPPLKPYSLAALRTLRSHLPASIPLIGCGGISTGADALEYAKAGASFVQLYTGFGYDGVGSCRRIKDELLRELEKEGKTWGEVVHEAVGRLSIKEDGQKEEGSHASSIGLLIREAEELKRLLDQLGERVERDRLNDALEESGIAVPPPIGL